MGEVMMNDRSTCATLGTDSARASTKVVKKASRLYDSHYILTKQEKELEQRIER